MTCPVCNQPGAQELGPVAERVDQAVIECPRCGRFSADALVGGTLQHEWNDRRHLISAGLRQASDSGHPLLLTADTLASIVGSVRTPVDLQEGIDRILLLLGARATRYLDHVALHSETDYPLVVARDTKQFNEYLIFAIQLGYYENAKSRITLDGWRRIEDLKKRRSDSRQAFVAMWFDPQMTLAYQEGFQPGIEDSGYFKALRIDKKEHNDKIDDQIVAEIRRSGLLVADFTGNRGGVYFESGLAQGLGIPVIWTCRKDHQDSVHFDTRQYNHIDWITPADLRTRLDQRIRATLLPRAP